MPKECWLFIRGVEPSLWGYPITESPQRIGRSSGCTIPLKHPSVSRAHAEVWRVEEVVHVRDLGSRNGTYLNGARICEGRAWPGGTLRIGLVVLDLGPDGQGPGAVEGPPSNETLPVDREAAPPGLTPAQNQVFEVMIQGKSEKEIAALLHLSPHTVHAHIKGIYRATGAHSRSELLARFIPHASASAPP